MDPADSEVNCAYRQRALSDADGGDFGARQQFMQAPRANLISHLHHCIKPASRIVKLIYAFQYPYSATGTLLS